MTDTIKDVPEGENYLAICPHYWGKGQTVEAAKRQLKAEGGSLTQYLVYKMPANIESYWVDGFGSVHWEWPEDYAGDTDEQPVIVAKRGIKAS